MSLTLLQLAAYVFPLITLPYLSRVIGVERFGEIAFANTVVFQLQILVDYGFLLSGVRDVARNRNDLNAVSQIYTQILSARLALTVVSIFALGLLVMTIPKFYDMRQILFLTILLLPGHAMMSDWMFQGLEKMRYITILNVGVKLFFTIMVFVCIKDEDEYLLHPILFDIGYFISGIASLLIIHRMGIRIVSVRIKSIWVIIKRNTDLFINTSTSYIYNLVPVLLLGFFHNSAANGIFDAGYKFAVAAQNVLYLLSRTFYPFLSRRLEKHSVLLKLNVYSSIILSIIFIIGAPWIVELFFAPEFMPATDVLRILAASLIFVAIANAYGMNWLIIKGYERASRNITIVSALISVVCSFPLVYYYSFIGAALAIVIARLALAALTYRKVTFIKSNAIL